MNSPTTNAEMLAFIKNDCKRLLGTKFWQIRFLCKVDAGWKSEKLETKYLVLSKFRLFFLSGKSASKLQVEGSYNLLSISDINATQEHELILGVDGRKLHLRLLESGYSAMDVARQLLQAFKNYFPACDPLRFMQLQPSSLYALFAVLPRSRPSLSCDGFRRTYAALCDFYKLPFRDEVVWDIEKIYTLHNNSILRIDDFSHLFAKDLIPLIASLQFMSWFNGISSESFKLAPEVVDAIIVVIKKSQNLKTLVLRNAGLKSDFLLLLASALTANSTIPLDTVDLSGNIFDENKAIAQFSSALSSLGVGFRSLILTECGLTAKAVNALCNALQQNQKRITSKTLSSISFAKNILKSDVNELYHLLSSSTLESLDISGTGISLEWVLVALKSNSDRITALNISGCGFSERKGKDMTASNSIKDFFANAPVLSSVDVSDCALPSDVLKFMLLGIVCNQKVNKLHLDLTRSFNDKQCIPVFETCVPNLDAIGDLVLRDNNLEQDALVVIRALAQMKNLRRLDIGGNNFNITRKQHPKVLVNIIMEVAKLINDEDGSIRELILSDCHLGANLSVLLNALGVAPTLISLDISGNDFGNVGARLLAKALQLNTVLQTLSIDKNQISYEGYADILHALKGNNILRYIPYPLHDACESLKWNRDKTESILTDIEQLLQRNKAMTNDATVNTEAHYRLMLTNVDDELNKAVYSAEHLLAECKTKETHPDVLHLRNLLDDAEKAKKLLDEMISTTDRHDFIDEFVQRLSHDYTSKFEHKLNVCTSQMTDLVARKNLSVFADQETTSTFHDVSMQRTRPFATALTPVFTEFSDKLRRHFSQATFALASGLVEKIEQEIIRTLAETNKNLDQSQMTPQISCGGSMISAVHSISSSGATPKSKRKKFRFFARSTRPKSIIEPDGLLDNMEEAMEDTLPADTPVDSCGDSLDSESFEVVDKSTIANEESDDIPKLTHVVKDRPRLPYQRRQRAAVTADKQKKDELDYAAGVNDFFSTGAKEERPVQSDSNVNVRQRREFSPSQESKNKEFMNADENKEQALATDINKRLSRIPANAVPLITADMLQERGLLTKMPATPRAPPNTPQTAGSTKPNEDSPVTTPRNVTGGSDMDTSGEVSSKHKIVVDSNQTDEKQSMLTCISAMVAAKFVPPLRISEEKEMDDSPTSATSEILASSQPKTSAIDGALRSVSPLKVSPSAPLYPQLTSTHRQNDDNGNNTIHQPQTTASEENNNASATVNASASTAVKNAHTPPPRPPPPPSAKLRDAKMRQTETANRVEPPEEPIMRNKPVASASAQNEKQRKSVMDLTAMFEHKDPPAGRPVPPPRPNKSKVAPAAN